MRICMFSNLFPPVVSGSSSFTSALSRRLVSKGHEVAVVTALMPGTSTFEDVDGVSVFRLPSVHLPQLALTHNFKWMTYTYLPRNIRRVGRLFQTRRFDVIHQQNHIFDTILSSRRMAARFGLPLILTVHTQAQHPKLAYDRILSFLDSVARKVVFEKADAVVSPDRVVQRYVMVRHRVPDSPVIPYGIEVADPSEKDVRDLKQRFGLGETRVLLSLGHVHKLRDRLNLIGAMPQILKEFPSLRLLIVGEVQIQEPVQLTKTLRVEENVVFTGPLPHSKIPALFRLSSLETHTFNGSYQALGIASMEAMAAGLPVITGDITDVFDEFENWRNIVMLPDETPGSMARAVIRLLKDEGLRERIGRNGKRLMAERFSWDAVAESYLSVYQSAIEKHGQGEVGATGGAEKYRGGRIPEESRATSARIDEVER